MKKKFTLLDGIMWLAGMSFVVVVIYRYRTQGYFDLYGLLMLGFCVLIYRQYRAPAEKKDTDAKPLSADEEKA